ncbi:MAG: 3-hydroxybutyryl-CoA dehydrogenase [Dermatophilaceae bacterium]
MSREIKKVGVIGLGTMGGGMIEVFARAGIETVGVEIDEAALRKAQRFVESSTAKAVEREKMTQDERDALLGRITFTLELADVAGSDIVVEAVPEDIELKREIFGKLDDIVGPEAILCTNSSALSITDMAMSTANPQRVMGMHFFNPVPVQQLVEVIDTVVTDPDIVADVRALAERLGKEPVHAGDRAGFIANALLMGYVNHAVTMFENKYATREDIDAAMKLGCGYPMGPLALADLVGLDTCYAILDTMYAQSGDRLHAPTPIFKQMMAADMLGRKSGRGFYTYEKEGSGKVVADKLSPAPRGEGAEGLRPISKVGVIGNGTMAMGIVEVFVKAGYDVTFVARSLDKADKGLAGLTKSLDRALSRGRLSQEKRDAALALAHPSDTVDSLGDVDIVVEAIAEELPIKIDMFQRLDTVCKPGCILATTTSSLPVIEIAAATSRPADVIGMHFFNPAAVMKLVEIVTTVRTGDDVHDTVADLCVKIGKRSVDCGDRAGFIVNALLFPYLNDAINMLEAHYASADDIDTAMKLGCSLPMGPFELLDVVGLDVSLAIQRELYVEFREPGFKPASLLVHLVKGGYLGRKTVHGFRSYR